VTGLGVFTPYREPVEVLRAGDVGYLTAGMKDVRDTRVGDTITEASRPAAEPFPGYREVKPMVFSGLYPVESGQYESLKGALEKLWLNDSSFSFDPETSAALGFGFRCGFLGMLHMEIIRERLEREYSLSLISTAPTVSFRLLLTDGREMMVRNPTEMPPPLRIVSVEEPLLNVTIMVPEDYLGGVIKLAQARRGVQEKMEYIGDHRVHVVYRLPLRALRSGNPGSHREPGPGPRGSACPAEERDRQVLRRRRLAEEETAGTAERGKEADETGRSDRDPARGLSVRSSDRLEARVPGC
jgi:GTP-binding protein LepA